MSKTGRCTTDSTVLLRQKELCSRCRPLLSAGALDVAVLQVMDLTEPLWPLTLAWGLPVRGAMITVLGYALFSPVAGLHPMATAGCMAQARPYVSHHAWWPLRVLFCPAYGRRWRCELQWRPLNTVKTTFQVVCANFCVSRHRFLWVAMHRSSTTLRQGRLRWC